MSNLIIYIYSILQIVFFNIYYEQFLNNFVFIDENNCQIE